MNYFWLIVLTTFSLNSFAVNSAQLFGELTDMLQPCDIRMANLITYDNSGNASINEDPFPSYQARQMVRIVREITSRHGIQMTPSLWNEVKSHIESYECQQRADGVLGACLTTYSVQDRSSRGRWYEIESTHLNPNATNQIKSLFTSAHQMTTIELLRPEPTAFERSLIEGQGVRPEAIAELRAMRAASALFERETYMASDRGGWLGNLSIGALNPEILMTCGAEMMTHRRFYRALASENLIRSVEIEGKRERAPDSRLHHVANTIRLPATNGGSIPIVLDSWMSHGGEPPVFCTTDEWDNRRSCPPSRIATP